MACASRLGNGMGALFRAWDVRLERDVTIKVVRGEGGAR